MDWHEIGKASLSATAVSAAISSTITKTVLFPIDTVKCRMQSLGFSGTRSQIFSRHKIFNGLVPKIALYAPYQSVYMTTYTWTRDRLGARYPSVISFGLAGVSAELAGAVIRLPMEVLKQRMQTGLIPSTNAAINQIITNPRELYNLKYFRAQTLFYDIPGGVVHWIVYEHFKRKEEWALSAGTSGAVAGIVTATITNPLDVVKTRIVTRGSEKGHETIRAVFKTVFSESGLKGFWKGLIPRIMHIAPNSAMYMWIFDTVFRSIDHHHT